MSNHCYFRNIHAAAIFIVVFCLMLPGQLAAQMFSVEEQERRTRPASSSFTLGMGFLDMDFRPDRDAHDVVYSISDPVLRAYLELPGIEAYAGYRGGIGNSEADSDTLSYLNFGANISGRLPLTGSQTIGLVLPLKLTTDFTRVRSTEDGISESNEFRQSLIAIGVGAGIYYNISSSIRFRIESVPQIGFTVSSLGTDSGQVTKLNTKARVHIDHVFGGIGMAFGYNYTWRRYSGIDERFEYDISSNNISIGITF